MNIVIGVLTMADGTVLGKLNQTSESISKKREPKKASSSTYIPILIYS